MRNVGYKAVRPSRGRTPAAEAHDDIADEDEDEDGAADFSAGDGDYGPALDGVNPINGPLAGRLPSQ